MSRALLAACVVAAAALLPAMAHAQDAPPTPPATGPAATYEFASGAGLLIFHVAPAKAADFDAVLARLKVALSTADSLSRRQQAANWLIYKSAEPPGESVVYLFLFDPAVPKASYDPLLVLAESLPAEAQPLYERMKAAVLRIERMGLTKVR
ncbi:MAG: hypothetical protein FJW21_06740 [Acidimicrobiia bacterium]|nr:hypothetical protein [Acidimicrobiia bacterium]